MIKIFGVSLAPEGHWDWEAWLKLISKPYYGRVLWFTFWQAAVSTILTVAAALPGCWIMAKYRFAGQNLIKSLTTVPFVLPTVVVAAAFRALLGENGLVNSWLEQIFHLSDGPIKLDRTIWFILLAHVFLNYTVVLRIVGGFWERLQPEILEAARMLGASPWKTFCKITLPLLAPALWASALLVFIFCFTSFGVVLILGGPRLATLEVEIYRQAVHIFNLPVAAALSLVQIVFTFALMWVYTTIQRKAALPLNPEAASRGRRPLKKTRERLLVGGNLLLIFLLLGAPLLALIIRSLSTKTGLGLLYYRALFENPVQSIFFVPPAQAVLNSLLFALTTTFLALFLGFSAAGFLSGQNTRLTALLDPLFMLPLATSAVTLGFGFIIALDKPPLNLRTSPALAPLAHTLVAFPFVVRSLLPAMTSIPKSLREAARMLGASPRKVWQCVDLPIIGRAALVGAIFAFSVSMGEFGATALVARPEIPTMPVAIYRFLDQPGAMNYGQAMAMSSLLMLVTASGFVFFEKFRIGSIGEF